ncbi:MAG: pyruvoyl-dependent arginine decarboxylase [Bacteroidia bacterium]|nr:pyruvoyl-dependent arginine decarboxylase [Bacteroidia bacterium]
MGSTIVSNLLCGQHREVNNPLKGLVIGNRIPKDYFITNGIGESDIAVHAGSYHLALKNAGIERANIMTYSSILPAIAQKVEKPQQFEYGSVMETIMAVAHGHEGEMVTAGIISGRLYNRKTGERFGGLVCEHNGNYTSEELENKLYASLNELYYNGFEQDYVLEDIEVIKETFVPKKKYGTAIVALCFISYIYPVLNRFSSPNKH